MIEQKLPPQAVDLETAILGALMVEKDAMDKVTLLNANHFYKDEHALIFKAMADLHHSSKPIDILTVQEQLIKNGHLDRAGGVLALATLTSRVSSAANIEYHSTIVMQKYNLREIIRVSATAIEQAFSDGGDPVEIQGSMFSELEKTQLSASGEPVSLSKVASDTLKELQTIQDSDKSITGIDTGYQEINRITNGWHAPNLVIMAGRPGTGKTASALNLIYNVVRQGIPAAFFSLEMSAKELMNRIISISAGVDSIKLRNATLDQRNWESIHKQNYNLPLYIDETSSISINEFRAKARKLVRKSGVRFIVVDYIQLMTANTKGNREQEIATIARNLKATAKELNVPILALAQLSRDIEKRGPESKPRLSDLRESGSLEQDADAVILLFDPNSLDKTLPNVPIEFIWAKHRNGACTVTELMFQKPTQRFVPINTYREPVYITFDEAMEKLSEITGEKYIKLP
jgi:replicative DNA helicase